MEISTSGGFAEVKTIALRDAELGRKITGENSVEMAETQVKELSRGNAPAPSVQTSRTKKSSKN